MSESVPAGIKPGQLLGSIFHLLLDICPGELLLRKSQVQAIYYKAMRIYNKHVVYIIAGGIY